MVNTKSIMDTETDNQNRKRRIILVKKKKALPPKTGIQRFDEYIQKSGLEPKIYQREGVEFCLRREVRNGEVPERKVIGGIIADEMGLGKTIMMMGLILANLDMYRRTLIVVPVALITQWVDQLKRTIIDTGVKSDLTVIVYHGSAGKRRVVLSGDSGDIVWCHRPPRSKSMVNRPIDIVITTYGCVAMEEPVPVTRKKKNSALIPTTTTTNTTTTTTTTLSLMSFRADRIVFDEAHHLRNKNSRIFKGAMRVVSSMDEMLRPSVWIVTGTPIQNKISDLKSLCYVLGFKMCELMSEEKRRAIRDEYVLRRTKVSVGMVAAAVTAEEAGDGADIDVTCAPRLQSLKHYKLNVPWGSENELALSREIHHKARTTSMRSERLKLYTRMRQMCVWPALLNPVDSAESEYKVDNHGLTPEQFKIAVSNQSKMDCVLSTMMTEFSRADSRKSIVFCHYRREMVRLREILLRSGVVGEENIAIIDGTVGARERGRIFADEPTVLILQIRTCSEGLNLQSYSNVYFISPHWNPCVEDQAIARCYRMGQTSQVKVFRFYMSDFVAEESQSNNDEEGLSADAGAGGGEHISTLDHKCEEIQERKRVLCNEFLC